MKHHRLPRCAGTHGVALLLLVVGLATGCRAGVDRPGGLTPEERERARGVPSEGTATITISGFADPLVGAFMLRVGPGELARFEFAGRGTEATVFGNYLLDTGDVVRSQSGQWIEYSPTDPFAWIYDNNGSLALSTRTSSDDYKIRSFSYNVDSDGLIAVRVVAVRIDRIDLSTRTIQPGDDLVVEVAGRITFECVADDGSGGLVDDPGMVLNAFCREFTSESPSGAGGAGL